MNAFYYLFDIIRGPGEEESSFPTRTVLITSLDSSVTVTELKSVFDQYGDIVVS